jgi:uncharacterized membrane protein YukC
VLSTLMKGYDYHHNFTIQRQQTLEAIEDERENISNILNQLETEKRVLTEANYNKFTKIIKEEVGMTFRWTTLLIIITSCITLIIFLCISAFFSISISNSIQDRKCNHKSKQYTSVSRN